MTGCQTCGGFGMHHDPIAHDAELTWEVCTRCSGEGGDAWDGPCTDCLGEGQIPVERATGGDPT